LTHFIILKPFSGSGSIALFQEIVTLHGPNSYITRVASVIAGSSETVFYISAVYFSKTKIRKLSYAIPVALVCVFAAAVLAAFAGIFAFSRAGDFEWHLASMERLMWLPALWLMREMAGHRFNPNS
jgi:spore maturation protein SpmB